MAISSLGLSSGIDFTSILTQLTRAAGQPLIKLQNDKVNQELKSATILSLSAKLSAFEFDVKSLNDLLQFNTRSATVTKTSTGDSVISAVASETAVTGNTSITVKQLAKESKVASDGFVDTDTTAIASSSGTFVFKLGTAGAATTISVGATTTLEQFRDAINNSDAEATASIINDGTGSNPYRLVITADSSGSANNIIVTTNGTNLDFANKKIEDIFEFTTNDFSGTVASNSGNFYTETGNITFLTKITTAGDTTGALSSRAKYKLSTDGGITFGSEQTVNTGGVDGTADIVIDSGNRTLVINGGANNITIDVNTYTGADLATNIASKLNAALGGGSDFSVSFDSATMKFTITQTTGSDVIFNHSDSASTVSGVLGFEQTDTTVTTGNTDVSDFQGGMFIDGAGVVNSTNGGVKMIFGTSGSVALVVDDKFSVDVFNPEMSAAQDAVIEVDNSIITKSSNTITDLIEGVTLTLLKVDTSEVTLSVSTDTSGAKGNIEDFVASYNILAAFIEEQSSFDPDVDGKKNPLLGDFTLQAVRRRLSDIISGTIPGVPNDSFNSLSSIGITSDFKTGKLSIDDSKLSSALKKDPDAVAKLFVSLATPTNSTIKFESMTTKTLPGTYGVLITVAPEQAVITGDNDLSSNGLTTDETLIFRFTTNNTDSSPDFTTFDLTLAQGSTINTIVNDLNSAFATNKVGLSASGSSGKLEIKSSEFGKDIFFQLSSNQEGDGSSVFQIFQDSGDSVTGETKTDAGVDIAGRINNHVGTGIGNVLTGGVSFFEEGLSISTKSSLTGNRGTITVSSGIAAQLVAFIPSYTNKTDGILKTKEVSIQTIIDGIKEQQDKIEKKLVAQEKQFRAQFARLEVIISQFKGVSDFLTVQLANLPEIRT
ncbi:MAG: flagellar filament capping protein FliD [Candidatus Anammoxibacter sp.]